VRLALLLPCAVLPLAFAPAPLPKPPRPASSGEDLKPLQGAWVRTSCAVGGRPGEGKEDGEVEATIAGGLFTLNQRGHGKVGVFALTLGRSKGARFIDFRTVSGFRVGAVEQGIYSLEGDTLVVCSEVVAPPEWPGTGRPTDLHSPHLGQRREVYRRKAR
jgi:uncharacterized protein (TIGR03067 family)